MTFLGNSKRYPFSGIKVDLFYSLCLDLLSHRVKILKLVAPRDLRE